MMNHFGGSEMLRVVVYFKLFPFLISSRYHNVIFLVFSGCHHLVINDLCSDSFSSRKLNSHRLTVIMQTSPALIRAELFQNILF